MGQPTLNFDQVLRAIERLVVCYRCRSAFRDEFLTALNRTYHRDCFRCHDCDLNIATAFYPCMDPSTGTVIPLCELHCYTRLSLLCNHCNLPLRGHHLVHGSHKYHRHHFFCALYPHCKNVLHRFYDYKGKAYCREHYERYFADSCEDCGDKIMNICAVVTHRDGKKTKWHENCWKAHTELSKTLVASSKASRSLKCLPLHPQHRRPLPTRPDPLCCPDPKAINQTLPISTEQRAAVAMMLLGMFGAMYVVCIMFALVAMVWLRGQEEGDRDGALGRITVA